MAQKTQVNEAEIIAQGNAHDDLSGDFSRQLNQTNDEAQNARQACQSQMTKALVEQCETWRSNVEKRVCNKLNEMGDWIRKEAGKQTGADEDNASGVGNVITASSTSSFLNG